MGYHGCLKGKIMGYKEGSYCFNCGLANWEGMCPHCSGEEEQFYNQQEPDIVPCFKCGGQMYWESSEPEGNICSVCKKGKD